MYNVTQAARAVEVSGTTIRNWSRTYSEYLSPSANPAAGQPREYTVDDLAVFSTIAVLREQLVTTEDIHAVLDSGRRLEAMRPSVEESAVDEHIIDQGPQAAVAEAQAAVAAAERAITIYEDRVTTLETRAAHLVDRLITAEARAAAAERELEILRELHAAADPGHKMSFWAWVQSRRK